MRICIVSQEFPPGYVGGIGTQSRVKARGLADLGHEVEVLSAGEADGPVLSSREDGSLRVHEVRTPGGEFAVYRTETYWIGYTWAVLGGLRLLTEERPFDVVDFPDYGAEGLAFQLDRQEDDPTAVVVHLHGSLSMFAEQIGWPEAGGPLHQLGTFMEGMSIRAADRLLAASRSIAEFTVARGDIAEGLVDVVLGAVDTEAFHPLEGRRASERVRLLFVGNVEANKGVWTVFEAFMRLASTRPELSLVIAGPGNPDIAAEMQAKASAADLSERFELLGFVDHSKLPELYRSADLVAAPSQYEGGLGMVYLEAMASGLPVIASAAGGAAEAVADGETGIFVAPGSAEEASAAIEALVADPRLRAQMAAAGRRRVEERFTVKRYAERVAEGYTRAINRRKSTVVTW
jgi:glycosyltransferase involved in cell wall biosynthesis